MCIRFVCSAILYVFILSCSSFATLYKGDKCYLKDGSEGICKLIKECPNALQLIKTRVIPVLCGFEEIQPIVCCKYDEVTNLTSTTTTTTVNPVIRTPGDISKQKCKEYAEYAYEKIPSPTLLLYPHFTKKLVCDIPRNKLTTGNTLVARREFPHMALVGYKDDDEVIWGCGGSLISENFVLTAAHCLYSRILGPATLVRFGVTSKIDLAHTQERTVSEVIFYPGYKYTRYHDIGLLRLSRNVDFNTYVRPACLQTEKQIAYDLAISTGWGTSDSEEQPVTYLLEIVLEFFSGDKCNSSYKERIGKGLKDGIIDDLMVCAGTSRSADISCVGDSGGPLQVYHAETEDIKCMYDIIGVVSFGISCGLEKDRPMVHTRVSNYIKWIENTVWPN